MNLIASKLSQNTESSMQSNTMEHSDHSDPSLANYTDLKLKSAHFSISFIKIGFWKIMWEVVEDGAKNRIVIPWDRICGIRASHPERCKSIIEIELNHQPDFEIEKILEPRKRVKPEPVPDFTQLQASHCRRHWIEVPEEDFNKHYEKILLCCPRLRSISGSSLPVSSSLFFQWCPPLIKEFRQPLKRSDSGGSSGTRNLLADSSSSSSVSALKSPPASIASSSLLPGNSAPSMVFSIPSSKGYQFSFNTHPVSNSPCIGNVTDATAPPSMLVSPSQSHGLMTGITSSSYPLVNSDGMNTTSSISTFVPPFDPHGLTIGIANPSGYPFLATNSLNSGYPLINSSHIGNAMAPQATMGITGSRDSPFSAFPQTGNVINATTTPPTLNLPYGPFIMGTGVSPPAIGFPISSYPVGISPYTVNATASLSSLDSSMGVPGLFFPDSTPHASNSLNTATPSNSAWCIASSSTSPSSPVESHIGSNISFANSSSPMPTPVVASATSPPSTMGPVSPLGVAQSSSPVWPSKSLGSAPISLASLVPPLQVKN
ncbi:hypothetical protein QJS10_CPA05g00238 [Acorus calamus]|uniref:TRF2/HOY1 PH-like domain-containing protein n=1 Tax=Acorus calamus TaxID=4465 RepID=A0AAV9EWV8_ACOCL|nr:hypothetical protein QJS10_CPA05g00238 [Acorus calamus]